jgi:hypothetical protein
MARLSRGQSGDGFEPTSLSRLRVAGGKSSKSRPTAAGTAPFLPAWLTQQGELGQDRFVEERLTCRPFSFAPARIRKPSATALRFLSVRVSGRFPFAWRVDDNSVELLLHATVNDRLVRQFLQGLVLRLLFGHTALYRLHDQLADLLALQRHQLVVGVELIELRAEIEGMDAPVVAVHDQVALRTQEQVVFLHDPSLPRCLRHKVE